MTDNIILQRYTYDTYTYDLNDYGSQCIVVIMLSYHRTGILFPVWVSN